MNNVPALKKKSKPLTKSSRTKQSCKSSYTIPKGLSNERHDECVKAKINVLFNPKQDPSLDENHWQKKNQLQPMGENGEGLQWSHLMGTHECLGLIHALFKYTPPIWTNAHVWHNRVDGGGIRFGAISKKLCEVNACALLYVHICNVS